MVGQGSRLHLHQVRTLAILEPSSHLHICEIFQKGLEPGNIQGSVGSGTAKILFNFVNILLWEKYTIALHVTAGVVLLHSCLLSVVRRTYVRTYVHWYVSESNGKKLKLRHI